MQIKPFIFFLLIITSCKKDPVLWDTQNLNGNAISILGHGGMGTKSLYPMNSHESLSKCLNIGADGVEMDVQLTDDNVLVLHHNQKLEESTSCNGQLSNMTWEEINGCSYKAINFNDIKLISLQSFMEKTENKKARIFTFDCKLYRDDINYQERFSNALLAFIIAHDLLANVTIESTSPDFLEMLHKKNKDLKLFIYIEEFKEGKRLALQLGLYGITMDMDKITKEEIAEAHANNLRIAIFNQTSEKKNIEAIQMQPDLIQTDKLEHLLKVFDKYRK